MSRLASADQILVVEPNLEDRYLGARYAGISLSWTYDRMEQEGSRARGTRNRAFNIAKGLVGQRALQRELSTRGVSVVEEQKSHRETDSYDLKFPDHPEFDRLDVKTFNHFTDYGVPQKDDLSPTLLGDNLGYEGPEWGHFFPLLIPYDQFSQAKEAYCFAISSSVDYRNTIHRRPGYELYAFPDLDTPLGDYMVDDPRKREAENAGFTVEVDVTADALQGCKFKLIGEWDGDVKEDWITFSDTPVRFGPISQVNSYKISKDTYDLLARSDAAITVRIPDAPDANIASQVQELTDEAFHNLLMPSEFTMYYLGWIPKAEFRERATARPAWKQPTGDAFTRNQPWEDVSPSDQRFLENNGLGWTLQGERPTGLLRKNAGCYYYPKVRPENPEHYGLRKTNLYVLPEDLRPMDTL